MQEILTFILTAAASETIGGAVYDSVKSLLKKHFGDNYSNSREELESELITGLEENPAFRTEAEQLYREYTSQIQVVNHAENVKIVTVGTNIGDIHL